LPLLQCNNPQKPHRKRSTHNSDRIWACASRSVRLAVAVAGFRAGRLLRAAGDGDLVDVEVRPGDGHCRRDGRRGPIHAHGNGGHAVGLGGACEAAGLGDGHLNVVAERAALGHVVELVYGGAFRDGDGL